MTASLENRKIFSAWMYILYFVFFISLVCSFRAITSISLGFLLFSGLAWNKLFTGRFFERRMMDIFFWGCLLFFFLQLAGLLYTHDINQQWRAVFLKTCLIVIPLSLNCAFINDKTRNKLLSGYCIILLTASLYCLGYVFLSWIRDHDPSVFFYFGLIKPLSQHAIQFSILVFVALVHLFESLRKNQFVVRRYMDILMILFFTVFIFLLSSKLVISFYLFYLLYYTAMIIKTRVNKRSALIIFIVVCMVAGSGVLVTKNSVSDRFNEIIHGDINLIRQKKFDPGIYFNGLQFRLLQWRFVPEILSGKKAWLAGVSAGDKQHLLDQKYISENMYIGWAPRNDRGFLGYNTHNQFLEALLQSGIMGLLCFILICTGLIKMTWQKKNSEMSFITILLLLYSFTESVFETQYSILIFLFLPLFFYQGKKSMKESERNP
jgi:O-antigen ligase